jgi:glycosyltransferase involved in cell wall biosynthesis
MRDGSQWPKISVVTPSYNQGPFIEEAIRSVLLQGYPDLEYVIIDGGSTDKSVEIIKKYEPWLAYWVSERDRGQPQAINKGLERCTGEVFNWINSDDLLAPGALSVVAEAMRGHDAVAGAVVNFDGDARTIIQPSGLSTKAMIPNDEGAIYHQPGIWLRLDAVKALGGVEESLHYCFDRALMMRYLMRYPNVNYTNSQLAFFRLHGSSKSVSQPRGFEVDNVLAAAFMLHDEELRARYGEELYEYLLMLIRSQRVNWVRKLELPRGQKAILLLEDMAKDCLSYPFRYTLGLVRRLLRWRD